MVDLSLILPCYNEKDVFENSIKRIDNLLENSGFSYEIILIDDKSSDNTRDLILKAAGKYKNLRYFFHKENMGRGATVSDGIKKAKGRVAGYIDIDLEVSEDNILKHSNAILSGYDVTYANRKTVFNILSAHRTLLHHLYIGWTKFLLKTPFNDTNAGCKFFNREKILPILDKVEDSHWFWDTEILYRAYKAKLKMKEIEALYKKNKNKKSTVKTISDTIYFFRKLNQFRKSEAGN